MKNNVYEAPKALILNVNACDVITASGGGAVNNMLNDVENDILGGGWFAAELNK